MTDEQLTQLSIRVGQQLLARGETVTTAESCNGGWIAKALTYIPGSSAWFHRGFVIYSNDATPQMVVVMERSLAEQRAVSVAVARVMAQGELR